MGSKRSKLWLRKKEMSMEDCWLNGRFVLIILNSTSRSIQKALIRTCSFNCCYPKSTFIIIIGFYFILYSTTKLLNFYYSPNKILKVFRVFSSSYVMAGFSLPAKLKE